MRNLLFLFLLTASTGCGNNNHSPSVSFEAIDSDTGSSVWRDKSTDVHQSDCYVLIMGRDTMVAHLSFVGDSVTGKMTFDNYEKDSSSGIVAGTKDQDRIDLWYSFHSEGMSSVLQIIFQVQESSIIRGIGEMDTKDDTAFYKDPANLDFPRSQTFRRKDCLLLPEKYR